jgi:hypothetical protein
MYSLLLNLEKRVTQDVDNLRAEAYGEIEEDDVKHLWQFENRRVPQSLPILFQNVSVAARKELGEVIIDPTLTPTVQPSKL